MERTFSPLPPMRLCEGEPCPHPGATQTHLKKGPKSNNHGQYKLNTFVQAQGTGSTAKALNN